ncbi:MAG: sugar transferase [Actinomycetota bacterium]|jgi:lipopolysaccharide/colanic/teichoic acid biosynthesis glycosyltransferase
MMRRCARPVSFVGTALAVLALGKMHAVANGYDFTRSPRLLWSAGYVALLVLAAYAVGLPEMTRSRWSTVIYTVAATLAASVVVSIVQLLAGSALLPRFVVLLTPALLLPLYLLASALAADGRRRDEGRDRLVAVTSNGEAVELGHALAASPERPATLVAVIEPARAASGSAEAGRRPLVDLVAETGATAVVLDRHAQADDSIVAQAALLHEQGVRVRTLSLCYDEWLGKLPISELERVSLMFDIGEVHRMRYGRLKRVTDLVAGGVGLVALAVAVPFVLVGNRVANRGPLFYRQARVGKNGCQFEILKFRTMSTDGRQTDWTAEDDPRITRFGAWLRRTHLDELPQAVNIVRGDLSVVGPRPEQPHYVAELAEKIPFYRMRHLVRPGLTGWAQVKYPYGASEADALEKLQYEFYYLRHQSLSLDLRIIGRTVRSVIGRDGR